MKLCIAVVGYFIVALAWAFVSPNSAPTPSSPPATDAKSASAVSSDGAPTSTPLWIQLISDLRDSHSVLPPRPDAHPVAAVYNREAIVPPQCYTQTGTIYNPCYTCHQDQLPKRENVMNDGDLQEAYSFSDLGLTNHWKNLFVDRTARVGEISDQAILDYISQDNYSALPERLRDAGFKGWIPDLANLQLAKGAFDEEGFAKDGSHWVAFSYKPFPSTFWPTNGSTDDVMIRLPAAFRTDQDGQYQHDIYKANLAIVEARIKGVSAVGCLPLDERKVGRDLNDDGQLTPIRRISNIAHYVGAAASEFIDSSVYPVGVEFAHTVRYLGIAPDGSIGPSTRMKEVRYMKKWRAFTKAAYARQYQLEGFDKEAGNLPGYQNVGDWGLDNGNGWSLQGFIEDSTGDLRANTFEETLFCMGCHNSIGSTIDKTFSLARKRDGAAGWGYLDLRGMPDAPTLGETAGEIATYLERVGGGSEFRHNEEMSERWFQSNGLVDRERVRGAKDVYELVTPSKERALMLNKAYKTIVEDQSYIYGRDATLTPPKNVYQAINNAETATLQADRIFRWNIILDWSEENDGAKTDNPSKDL